MLYAVHHRVHPKLHISTSPPATSPVTSSHPSIRRSVGASMDWWYSASGPEHVIAGEMKVSKKL